MGSTKSAKLSPEVEKHVAELQGMTLDQVQRALMECMSDIATGRVTAYEGNAISRPPISGWRR